MCNIYIYIYMVKSNIENVYIKNINIGGEYV